MSNKIFYWYINNKIKVALKIAKLMKISNVKINHGGQHIIFIEMDEAIVFHNPKNYAFMKISFPEKYISYRDSMGNIMVNYPTTIKTNEGYAPLPEMGRNAWSKDGDVMAFIATKDIQELATKTFFEPDQEPIIDFYSFAIDKTKCVCIKQ
jgi:hypothetical protein